MLVTGYITYLLNNTIILTTMVHVVINQQNRPKKEDEIPKPNSAIVFFTIYCNVFIVEISLLCGAVGLTSYQVSLSADIRDQEDFLGLPLKLLSAFDVQTVLFPSLSPLMV